MLSLRPAAYGRDSPATSPPRHLGESTTPSPQLERSKTASTRSTHWRGYLIIVAAARASNSSDATNTIMMMPPPVE